MLPYQNTVKKIDGVKIKNLNPEFHNWIRFPVKDRNEIDTRMVFKFFLNAQFFRYPVKSRVSDGAASQAWCHQQHRPKGAREREAYCQLLYLMVMINRVESEYFEAI